ncbi:MAG: hypothetical protein K0R24_315 [Gammaproteobacteria bacterium]|jgi:hypothetical protein|nr:hypothetical protein [Gammaproteobacteria bacterium]
MANPRWRKVINAFSALADAANAAGIGSHIIISLLPIGTALLESVFSVLTFYADPLIYCFRAAIRVTRLIGRKFYSPDETDFEEEEYGVHPDQNKVDVIATGLFLMAIGLFFVPSSLLALQAALAWFLGLAGTVMTIYFDHYWPSLQAQEKLTKLDKTSHEYKEKYEKAETYANQKYYSTRLYATLICGMLMLLVIGSITTAGFPLSATTVLLLNGIAKAGSVLLVAVNVARPINWAFPGAFHKGFCWVKEKIYYCLGWEQPEASNRPVGGHSHSRRSSTANILAEAPPQPAHELPSVSSSPPSQSSRSSPGVEVSSQDPAITPKTRWCPIL